MIRRISLLDSRVVLACWALLALPAGAAEPVIKTDIAYYSEEARAQADDYLRTRCQLDIRTPQDKPGFTTVIWFHGGGLNAGKRYFPDLREKDIGLVTVGYRLMPAAKPEEILQDAAAAVAWVLKNIESFGGDPKRVFVSGHSAGGYLAAMITMDPRWLAAQGETPEHLAGLIAASAQVTTHFNVKKQRGDTGPTLRPVIDEFAPLHYAAAEGPPICLVTGDRDLDIKGRVEENELLAATLKHLGHRHVEFFEMKGLDHNNSNRGSMLIVPGFLSRTAEAASLQKP